jgi:hypothetical protein
MRDVKELDRLLTEIGYELKTPLTTSFSTYGQLVNIWRKGDKEFTYGLGQYGLPPMILHPSQWIKEESFCDKYSWGCFMTQQELNNYYNSLTEDEFKNLLR